MILFTSMTTKKQRSYETPMMMQYLRLKEQYAECILFFRLGDFYEMFLDDAKLGADILGITLTKRTRGRDGEIPMAGVPYHAVDSYIAKLVKNGYKVAICEQLSEDTGEEKVVERDVVRIVTPGTLLDETNLETKTNNFICAIYTHKNTIGLATADITTGFFQVDEYANDDNTNKLIDTLTKYIPQECLVTKDVYKDTAFLKNLNTIGVKNIFTVKNPIPDFKKVKKTVTTHFGIKSLESFGIKKLQAATTASYMLLEYVKYTQKTQTTTFTRISKTSHKDIVALDRSTVINLELLHTIRTNEKLGSLIKHLDKTVTSMGARLMKVWMLQPSKDLEKIKKRQDVVEEYLKHRSERTKLQEILKEIHDIERLSSKLSWGIGSPRDLVNLKESLTATKKLLKATKMPKPLMTQLQNSLNPNVLKLIKKVSETMINDPPIDPKQGNLVKENINVELDRLRSKIGKSKQWISNLENTEKKRTGISNLKVGFNKVFGFYIEVSKSNLKNIPKEYERKQTLVNAERFVIPELKVHEEIILSAEEILSEIEYKIFLALVEEIRANSQDLRDVAQIIAQIDCLLSFAQSAELENYCRPVLTNKNSIDIKNGRHPVVEALLQDHQFVPNDTVLNKTQQLMILTGPNMAGKSVYIRQVALIVLLAHMGSFVPAESAEISLVDKIFVRSGASDVITSGLSTFMVEMVETANILNNATSKSLIVMDEIGRGTSTYDGISIAWSIAEYLVTNKLTIYPKTLFATHYHELERLEQEFQNKVKNFQMAVEDSEGEPIFLHKVLEGGAKHSYGIAVAKLAGLPKSITTRAEKILHELEERKKFK